MGINQYPHWKNYLVVLILLIGLLYALPNLFGEDPAIQILPGRGIQMTPDIEPRVSQALINGGFDYTSIDPSDDDSNILVRLAHGDTQLSARDAVQEALGDNYTVALNLAPATPTWLRALSAEPMKLGLDLRGGVSLLMQVDVDSALERRDESYVTEIRNLLRTERIRNRGVRAVRDGGIVIQFDNAEDRSAGERAITQTLNELQFTVDNDNSQFILRGAVTDAVLTEARDSIMEQSIATLRNRVNELGVAEAVVQRQGLDRIAIQLPGIQDTARAKSILGRTATVEFHMVDTTSSVSAAVNGSVPPGRLLYRTREGEPVLLMAQTLLSGDNIIGAQSGLDEYGSPNVNIRLGGNISLFSNTTRENIGNPMATLYIESRNEADEDEPPRIVRTEEVISVATIQSALGNRFQITGVGSSQDASALALLLRAGALPATIDIIEERTVGPSLGQENIEKGVKSVIAGLILVLLFMVIYYRLFGIIANLALLANLILLVAILSLIGATVTLPSIAAIVLTLGMAVDANVLIFERIKEEYRNGVPLQSSIHAGYEKALVTILDANVTTFIAAVVLLSIGTGPIKGFALTLSIGLVTSVFTAVMVSRSMVNYIYGARNKKQLSIGIKPAAHKGA